jgi:hypothetical protein
VPFGEDRPVISAFEATLPKLREAMGLPASAASPPRAAGAGALPLPPTLVALAHEPDDPAQQVEAFALLAGLTPKFLDDARSRFEAKAYLASLRVATTSPAWPAARARALKAANLRQAALAVLPHPHTPSEQELVAALNGDLPGIEASASKESSPLRRLLDALDESLVRANYELKTPDWPDRKLGEIKLPAGDWTVLAGRALRDSDSWLRPDSTPLKRLLDAEFPVKGASLEDLQAEAQVFGESALSISPVALSVQAHPRNFVGADPARWCCIGPSAGPTELDLLDLIEAIGRDDLVRPLHLINSTQGQPEAAQRMAQALEPTLRGEPYFELRRAQIELNLSSRAPKEQRAGLASAGYERASGAYYWAQGQLKLATEAYEIAGGVRPQGYFENMWAVDRPMRPWYHAFAGTQLPIPIEPSLREALASATSQFDAFTNLAWYLGSVGNSESELKALERELDGRFQGSPRRGMWLAERAFARDDLPAAASAYRHTAQLAHDYWPAFQKLGELLTISGKPDEAAKAMSGFSGFAEGSAFDRVSVANFASDAASLFYWSGRLDLAQPLLQISAGTNTGAGAEMMSKQRLDLIDGRLDLAAEQLQERAQRYRDADAYADYLSLLQAAGRSSDAWRGFGVLLKELKDPQLLDSAMVGQRLAGAPEHEVTDWARKDDWRGIGDIRGLAAWHLARSTITDRTPGPEVAGAVDELDLPTWAIDRAKGFTVRSTSDPQRNYVVGPDSGEEPRLLPIGALGGYNKHRIRSDLSYFAQGYAELKHGDYAAAARTLKEAASYYDINSHNFAYINPYLTLAQSRAGLAAEARDRLKPTPLRSQGMDYLLSMAILEAGAGRVEAARSQLSLARYRIYKYKPRLDLPEYTFADIVMYLVEATHDAGIREILLDWVRRYETIEPWHAWSFAVEARLVPDGERRQYAIAMAHYLDPGSERLSTFSAAEIDAAVKAQAASNPFLAPTPNRDKSARAHSASTDALL